MRINDVSFFYADDDPDDDDASIEVVSNPSEITQVFRGISTELPVGMMSVVGQNGIGKSTLLLLASGRLFPHEGTIEVLGTDTSKFADAAFDPELEAERNRLVSFVYQNMEFESEAPVRELMEFVLENGYHETKPIGLIEELIEAFELESALSLKTQQLAKGQLQRAIIAFSLLYGSRIIMMDEPVFALEEPQKDRVFAYLLGFSRSQGVPIYYSAHNLELTQKYSDYMLLFSKTGDFKIGTTKELFTREEIEAAYQAPMDSLYSRDMLYRDHLLRSYGAGG